MAPSDGGSEPTGNNAAGGSSYKTARSGWVNRRSTSGLFSLGLSD